MESLRLNLFGGNSDRGIGFTSRKSFMFGVFGIYLFLKFMIFFSIVRALVKFETIGNHVVFLGILYTSIVAFISFVFVVPTQPDAFNYPWILQINRATHLSPWLIWLAETLVVSTLYFKLLSKFDEGILFWILLILGIPIALH